MQNYRYSQPVFIPYAGLFQKFLGVIKILLSWLSTSLEVLLHRQFGWRHLTRVRIILNLLAMFGVHRIWANGVAIWKWEILRAHGRSDWFLLFMSLFLAVSLYHRLIMWWERRQVEMEHSYDRGIFWGVWHWLPFSETVVYCYAEPLLCFAAAVWIPDQLLQMWIIVAALALFFRNQIDALMVRWWQQDIDDGAIEAGGGLSGEVASEVFRVRVASTSSPAQITTSEAYQRLDPRLRALMDEVSK